MTLPTPSNPKSPPKVVTLGCRLNGYESERMADLATRAGLQEAVIVNTCAVTGEAVRQARQTIRRLSRDNPSAKIIVTGCAAQIDPQSFSAMGEVSHVIGNHEKMLPSEWSALSQRGSPMEKISVNDIMTVTQTAPQLLLGGALSRVRSYVQIQNGCDHRCTFCIIPYGRGNSRSVPMGDVIREIHNLVEQGTAEIVLTGVDITSYGPDLPGSPTLGALVKKILTQVPDLPRLRLSSIDGAEIDDTLLKLVVTEERIAPHLHLSLQAGDNMILKRMKRRHTRAQAIDFCARLHKERPDIALGADLIAGFPTETDAMFDNTRSLITECNIVYTHIFPYSAREGTPAARMPQVDKLTIKQRAKLLREEGAANLSRFLASHIGTEHLALIENVQKSGGAKARLANFAEVELPQAGDYIIGQTLPVTITKSTATALIGAPQYSTQIKTA